MVSSQWLGQDFGAPGRIPDRASSSVTSVSRVENAVYSAGR